jgi:protein phosphatase
MSELLFDGASDSPADASATLVYPPVALVLLCGISGSGKSTFAARHFAPSQIVSSDACRAMVADDPDDQAASDDAFALLEQIVALRLKRGRFTVVDSTGLRPRFRARLSALARPHRISTFVLALDTPLEEAIRRDAARPERRVGQAVIAAQRPRFESVLARLPDDPLLAGWSVLTPTQQAAVRVERAAAVPPVSCIDVIGDVHGCLPELHDLLGALGYQSGEYGLPEHPERRMLAFVGDLADRGPDSPGVLRLVCDLVAAGRALFVPGNHDDKLFRLLRGARVQRTNGLDRTEFQLDALPAPERQRLRHDVLTLLGGQPPYRIVDDGRLVIAHAGITQKRIGRYDDETVRFTRYGDVRGVAVDGKPIRYDWAQDYRGPALIAYGHTPQETIRFVNNTVNLDGGCVFGGFLAALRYPEREIVTVPARAAYSVR